MSDTHLTRLLHGLLRRQQARAFAAIREGRPVPSFTLESAAMAEVLQPMVTPYFLRGGRRAARDIGRKVRVRHRERLGHLADRVSVKMDRHGGSYGIGQMAPVQKRGGGFAAWLFRTFFPRVEEAVRRLTLDFCEETNRTTVFALRKARSLLRSELLEGLEEGEALVKLTQRVRKIFSTERAYTIARTESARAVEAGGVLAAQESGVVNRIRWIVAPEACDICLALADKEVEIGQPFMVHPRGGPYAVVFHAPAHPHCRCSTEYVVEDRYR